MSTARSEAAHGRGDQTFRDRAVVVTNAELALALVKFESYCIHGWPAGCCASFQDDEHVNPVGRTCHHVAVEVYQFSRLGFKADVIEPLGPRDRFPIVTPEGAFEMTKADFHRDFANVANSMSYRDRGLL